MQDKISRIDINKAAGINSSPVKTVQLAKELIAEHLCKIYNLSFTAKYISAKFKNFKGHSSFQKRLQTSIFELKTHLLTIKS